MIITPGQPNPYHLDLSGLKILIVDDFGDMRSMMRRTVESFRGSSVEMARDGDEALEKMASIKFDLVLCDYNLGDGKDGQQILEEAKYRKYISSTTIWMMITAETTVEMVMGALEYKPDDYLTKPFTKQEFALRVMKIQARKKEIKDVLVARDAGAYEQALEHVTTHLNKKETLELLQIRADLHERLEAWSDADAVYNLILSQRQLPWAQLGHARILIRNQRYDEAKEILNAAIAQMPTLVEAYDLLASIHESRGDKKSAQQVLESAITQSPKAILRQKALARIAYDNGDLESSAKAYRRIIKMGRSSVHKAASDYVGLARIHADQGSMNEVTKLFSTMREEFKHQPDELLQGLLAESEIYAQRGAAAPAALALDQIENVVKKAANISDDVAIRLIKTALVGGRDALADELTQLLLRNNHDDATIIEQVKTLYGEAGKGETIPARIDAAQRSIRDVLDKCAALVTQGEMDEAIAQLQKAVTTTPNNVQLNLILAQTLIKSMQQRNKNDRHLFMLRQTLERIRRRNPDNESLPTLQSMYRQLFQTKN